MTTALETALLVPFPRESVDVEPFVLARSWFDVSLAGLDDSIPTSGKDRFDAADPAGAKGTTPTELDSSDGWSLFATLVSEYAGGGTTPAPPPTAAPGVAVAPVAATPARFGCLRDGR